MDDESGSISGVIAAILGAIVTGVYMVISFVLLTIKAILSGR